LYRTDELVFTAFLQAGVLDGDFMVLLPVRKPPAAQAVRGISFHQFFAVISFSSSSLFK
jgi:hypothetical protein